MLLFAMKRCILLKEESASTEQSKALANLLKVTVWTLQSEQINRAISFTLAKFKVPENWVLRTELSSLILGQTLVFVIRKISRIIYLNYWKSMF